MPLVPPKTKTLASVKSKRAVMVPAMGLSLLRFLEQICAL
jgi:hypothetical protein